VLFFACAEKSFIILADKVVSKFYSKSVCAKKTLENFHYMLYEFFAYAKQVSEDFI